MKRLTVAVLLVAAAACGASKTAIIHRTMIGLDAARDGSAAAFERWQEELIDQARDRERVELGKLKAAGADRPAAEAAIAAIRADRDDAIAAARRARDKSTKAYQAACVAIAAAALEPSDLNLRRMVELVATAVAAFNAEGGAP